MRVFVLGKPREVTHWTEDCLAGFHAAGHSVALGVTRDPRLGAGLERLMMRGWAGAWPVRRVLAAIQGFRPDLILAVRAFATPLPILDAVAALPGRPPLVGWVGDGFDVTAAALARRFDAIGYTDTAMLARHRELGFRPASGYVPHAAGPAMDTAEGAPRRPMLAFVANPTPHRRAVIAALAQPVALFGPAWTDAGRVAHLVTARRIGSLELATIYRSHLGSLNIHHEDNVVHGLNQRHFDPPACGTPVLTDAQADLSLCFEPDQEALVWSDTDQLNELHARLLREPAWALAIGAAARRRVLAHHTYGHRLTAFASLAGGIGSRPGARTG